jgi:hypothetical protein
MRGKFRGSEWFCATAGSVVVTDQVTKQLAEALLPLDRLSVVIIPGVLGLFHTPHESHRSVMQEH